MATRNIRASDLNIGTRVATWEETLWGPRRSVETVTELFCETDTHLIEAQLRTDQVLKHILRLSDYSEVQIVVQ